MKQIDKLFTNAIVLTMDDEFRQFSSGAVAVEAENIIAVGPEEDLRKEFSALETIDCHGKVLMPGLINVHTHAPMSLTRGLADDLRLDVWLMGYIMPVEREFVTPDFVKLGTLLSCAEMIKGGTTCFADMYYFEESVAEAAAQAGMRAVCGETVLKFPSPDSKFYEEALERTRNFIQKWKGHPLIVPAVAPHAPYTCTPEILKACADLAIEFGVPLHIHLAETTLEVERMRSETGMPVIPYVKKQHLFTAKTIAAHCVHVDEGEIRALASSGVGVAHNPSSNMKLASGSAPIKKMLDLNVNVGIGTDGPASNNDLDMFEEIRLASLMAKLSTGDPTAVNARTAMAMATRIGAKAIHLGDITGSISPGKRADLILVDLSTTHNNPRFKRNPSGIYAQIVYAAKSTDVSEVMINGQFVMRDRKLLTLNEADLIHKSQEYAKKMDAFLIEREKSLLSKLIAIGGAMEEESFEIQLKVRIEDSKPILEILKGKEIHIERTRHYREFDTYFMFDHSDEGSIRFREDEFVDENGDVTQVRARLTLIGKTREDKFQEVLLSRSRYFAPASNSLRFYREYFKPKNEKEVHKDRLRFLVKFKDTEFFINIDHFTKPELGRFLEIKSRTWSQHDAQQKSGLVSELVQFLGITSKEFIANDYLELIKSKE